MGDSGPYRDLREEDVIEAMAHRTSGAPGYVLMRKAFFVDRQNYRADVIARLFGYLAIEKATGRIAKHPLMRAFLSDKGGDASTFESELNRFVNLRNEAAHSEVQDVLGKQEVILISEFITIVCEIIAEITESEVFQRRLATSDTEEIGTVLQVYGSGFIPIVQMKPCQVAVGDDLIILCGNRARSTRVESIQIDGEDFADVSATEGLEVGFRLDVRCRPGVSLGRFPKTAELQPFPLLLEDSTESSIYVNSEIGPADDFREEASDVGLADGDDPSER